MAENKLEIKLLQDSASRVVELDSMSPEAAITFSKIIAALAEIIEKTPGAEGTQIGLVKGSAAAVVDGTVDQITALNTCFEQVTNNECSISEVVAPWREIQDLFKSNGLVYDASFKIQNQSIPIYSKIKENKRFVTKAPRHKKEHDLRFYKGMLTLAGGSNPNLHIRIDDQERHLIVDCSPISAKRATRFLYDHIMISTWRHGHSEDATFEYCDTYATEQQFEFFVNFFDQYRAQTSKVDALIHLHKACASLIEQNEMNTLKKMMRLFDHSSVDVNDIKTILVVTRSFRESEEIRHTRNRLLELFENKTRIKSR